MLTTQVSTVWTQSFTGQIGTSMKERRSSFRSNFRRKAMRRVAVFVLFVVFAICARAQFDTATVLGTVTDPSGAVVPHCQVSLHNSATGALATVATDERGEFRFIDVSIVSYE